MANPRASSRRGAVPLSLTFRVFSSVDSLANIHCLACAGPLDFHQPDPDLPQRMLGTCDSCKTWYLITFTQASDDVVLVQLPVDSALPPTRT